MAMGERGEVLLMRDVPIARDEDVEVDSRHSEQLPVGPAGPPHLGNGSHVMANEIAFQAPRHSSSRTRTREQRLLGLLQGRHGLL
jgi:hypothetical protein